MSRKAIRSVVLRPAAVSSRSSTFGRDAHARATSTSFAKAGRQLLYGLFGVLADPERVEPCTRHPTCFAFLLGPSANAGRRLEEFL
jgi:hypothetical protein